ncbi:MAG: glycine cleavage system protein GcvH [Sandaracinaceae bacterium]|nr:glycine cleavage system protein GcvH [Sandaracinaceae bacterium]
MAEYPSDLKYTKDHEWARVEGDRVRFGVTAYAVEQLGDVTLIDLPKVGAKLAAGERFGDIESVKTVSELFAPIGGEVLEVNGALEAQPELVNDSTYDQGWMLVVRAADAAELGALMDAAAYQTYLGTLDH